MAKSAPGSSGAVVASPASQAVRFPPAALVPVVFVGVLICSGVIEVWLEAGTFGVLGLAFTALPTLTAGIVTLCWTSAAVSRETITAGSARVARIVGIVGIVYSAIVGIVCIVGFGGMFGVLFMIFGAIPGAVVGVVISGGVLIYEGGKALFRLMTGRGYPVTPGRKLWLHVLVVVVCATIGVVLVVITDIWP